MLVEQMNTDCLLPDQMNQFEFHIKLKGLNLNRDHLAHAEEVHIETGGSKIHRCIQNRDKSLHSMSAGRKKQVQLHHYLQTLSRETAHCRYCCHLQHYHYH